MNTALSGVIVFGLCYGAAIHRESGAYSETNPGWIRTMINPYLDLSFEFGKEYHYEVPGSWFGEQMLLSYEGISVAAGIEVRPQNFPASVHATILKPILINDDKFRPDAKAYWEIGAGVIPYKRSDAQLEIHMSYLRNFGDFLHSTFVLSLNARYEYRAFDFSGSIGGYLETGNAGGSWRTREHPIFMSFEMAVGKWLVVPYVGGGLICRYYESEATADLQPVHERLMPVYTVGVRLRLHRPSFMVPSVTKMTMPKGRQHIS